MRHAAELKTSQPVFPGQPPPLARVETHKQNYQPPPRQSSQPPQRNSNRTAFPGQAPPATTSPSNFREPVFSQQQQQQRPDLIIQKQQSPQIQQQPSPQQIYNNPSPQSVASPQGYYQNPSPHDQHYQQQQQYQQQQVHQQQMQQKRSTPTPTPPPRKKVKPQQPQQFQQQQYNQQQQQQQQDVGLARLGALSALADLGANGEDILNEASTINYEDLNLGFQGGSKQQGQRWLNRASELLDLSSGDSREGHDFEGQNQNQGQGQAGLIPQIVMNPWDPSQAPMMTFAVQAYQHQWLLQQQQNLNQVQNSVKLQIFREITAV